MKPPGLALAAATRSRSVLKPLAGDTTVTLGELPSEATAAKSCAVSYGEVRIDRGRDRMLRRVDQERIAVRLRARDDGAPIVPPAPPRFSDDDGLAELLRQRVEHDARNDVDGAAGRHRNDGADRFRRPALRPRDARNERRGERGAGERQALTACEFHDGPLVLSTATEPMLDERIHVHELTTAAAFTAPAPASPDPSPSSVSGYIRPPMSWRMMRIE